MGLLVLLVFLTSYFEPLLALKTLDETCKSYIERNNTNLRLYRIAREINVTEVICHKKVVDKSGDCPDNYFGTQFTTDSSTYENCEAAVTKRIYPDGGYSVREINREILVGTSGDKCTYIRVGNPQTAYLFMGKILLKSGDICNYDSGTCQDTKTRIWLKWDVRNETSEIPTEKYKYGELYQFNKTLVKLWKNYVILERGSQALELKITKISPYYDKTTIFYLGSTGLVLADQGINNNWDNRYKGLLPLFDPKEEVFDAMAMKCRLYHLEKYKDEEKAKIDATINELTYVIYFVTVIVACVVVYLAMKTFKKFQKWNENREMLKRECGSSEPVSDIRAIIQPARNVYEYVTSEYNINEFYNKK